MASKSLAARDCKWAGELILHPKYKGRSIYTCKLVQAGVFREETGVSLCQFWPYVCGDAVLCAAFNVTPERLLMLEVEDGD